jgi:flagellar biosynthetic protein FlhB
MAEEEKDKSEPATPFKLEEARRRGQVVKSLDVNSLLVLGALLIVLLGWGRGVTGDGGRLAHLLFAQSPASVESVASTAALFEQILADFARLLAPFMAAAAIAAVLANLVQTGAVFSAHPIKPDFQRLNPVNGFKRLFSLRTLFETGKTLLKLVLLCAVAYLALDAMLAATLNLQHAEPRALMFLTLDEATSVLFKLLLVLAAIALLDLAYTRWEYAKRMRMSRRELKDEIKRREGDPHIRARLRELRQEMVKRSQSIKRLPEADVLITNPDHYAVALQYDRRRMDAPRVIAKGADELARLLKRTAAQAGVPQYEDAPLARRLFAEIDLDQPIAGALFEPVARVYAWLYAQERAERRLEVRL